MKVTIRDDIKSTKNEPEMNLYLEPDDGSVILKATDVNGNIWRILTLLPSGYIFRYSAISQKTGWPINYVGQLKLTTE